MRSKADETLVIIVIIFVLVVRKLPQRTSLCCESREALQVKDSSAR